MSLILRSPNMIDIALCAANLIEADRQQWREFTGFFGPDSAALECWNYPGPRRPDMVPIGNGALGTRQKGD